MTNPIAKLVIFPKYAEENGVVYVYEEGQHVPFAIRRVFTVTARKGDIRGDHAHRTCAQLLVSVSGHIRVVCDQGGEKSSHMLDNMNMGLLVPAGVWATQEYTADNTVLMVLCDHPYETADYIRDRGEYAKFLASR